jgi:hypothetical protein
MLDTRFENIIEWGKHYEAEELRKRDESDVNERAYRTLARIYSEFMAFEPPLSEDAKEGYLSSCKAFANYCATLVPDMDIRCLPPRPGIVAAFLHELKRDNGATHAELQQHADALSYLARLNETANPCDDPLVKAILKSADPKGRLTEDQN